MSPARCPRIAHPCKHRPCGTRTPCPSISLAGFPRCQPCLDRLFWVTPIGASTGRDGSHLGRLRRTVESHRFVASSRRRFPTFSESYLEALCASLQNPLLHPTFKTYFCPLSGRFCDPLYEFGKPLEKSRKTPLSHQIKTHTHPSHTTNTPNKTPLYPRPPTRQSYGTPPLHPSKHVDFHKSGLSGGGSSRRSR